MRILALDWGTVRVGVAMSDESATIASPFEKVLDTKTALKELKEIITKYEVGLVVVGLPKKLDGTEGQSADSVKEFAGLITKETGVPIKYFDERFSSVAAGKTLSEQGISQKKQRGMVDNLAAQQMLQTYLETKN